MGEIRSSGDYKKVRFQQGENPTRKMRQLFPWMTEREINTVALPSFQNLNSWRIGKEGYVHPGIVYEVDDFIEPLPTNLTREPLRFTPTDIQATAANKTAELARIEALSRDARDKEYYDTYKSVGQLGAFTSMVSGKSFNMPAMTPLRSSGSSSKGTTKSIATQLFTQNLMEVLRKSGGKLTDEEVVQFLDSQKAGPPQIELMRKMKDWIDIGDIQTLFRINETSGELEYLNRYPHQITPEIRLRGWKDKATLELERKVGKDVTEEKKRGRLEEIQALITGLLPFPDPANPPEEGKINWIPRNEEEYQKLKQQLKIKLPEAEEIFRRQLGIEAPGGKKAYAYTAENGKSVTMMLTDREYAEKLKDKKYEGLRPYDIYTKEISASQSELISNLAEAESQIIRNTELDGNMRTPLTLLQFQLLARERWAETGIPIQDIKKFDEQSAAAFMGKQKKQEQHNTDLSILMGQISTFTDWDDFADKSKGMDNEAVIKVATELERRNKNLWDYTGPRIVFNRQGEKLPVSSWPDLLKAKQAGYDYDKYNDAKDRPVHVVSDRFWATQPAAGLNIMAVNVLKKAGNKEGMEMIYVWTPEGEKNEIDATRNDISKSVSDFEAFTQRISMILQKLKEGQRGTDFGAIRDLEKLQDETGVIRESDVLMIKQSIGRYRDVLEKFINKITEGDDTYLTQDERDQVANHALTTLMVLQDSMRANIKKHELEYKNSSTFTWISKGRDTIDFHSVLNKEQYDKYMEVKEKKDYWEFQPGFSTPTVQPTGEKKDAGAKSPQLFWDPKTERPEFEGGKWWIYQMNPDGSRGKFLRMGLIFDEE
tara:strand:+ start:930 stop:3404 length:2475 start_codon:yes stop_codon:yes gene_type:complete